MFAVLLELEHVNKSFLIDKDEYFHALKDINLIFDKGEFVSILGPSGCGKSTLLNIMAGLDKPSMGDLIIEDSRTSKFRQRQWSFYRKNNIGFVFQSFNLITHLNALENVEIPMSLTGISKRKRRKRALQLLEQVGLKSHAKHLPSELSGGQQQRVAIARALANDPDIILADEPTGALDTKTGIEIMNLLKEIAQDKLVIMVTHNNHLAYEYSTRVIRMLDGEVIGDEKIKEANTVTNHDRIMNKKNKKMPLREAFRLSLRNMKKKKGRVFITALAGSIGIAGITMVLGLSNGANKYIDEQVVKFANSNVLTVNQTNASNGKAVTNSENYLFINDNNKVSDVRVALGEVGSWLVDNKKIDINRSSLAGGKNQDFLKKFLIGRLPKPGQHEIIVNQAGARAVMKQLNLDTSKTKYESMLNKKITLDISEVKKRIEYSIVGIIDEIDINRPDLYYDYSTMAELFESIKLPTQNTLYDLATENSGQYEAVLKKSQDLESVSSWIVAHAPEDRSVQVSSLAKTFQETLNLIILLVQAVMVIFLILALVVSSILIAIVLYSSVLERKTEIGILKAIGARNKDIMRVFNAEAVIIGLLAGLIGIGIAFALTIPIEMIATKFSGMDFNGMIRIPLSMKVFKVNVPLLPLILLILVSIFVAYLAGHRPSKKATKMEVIDALRDE